MNPFKQKVRDEIDKAVRELIAAEPRIQIKAIAQRLQLSEYQVHVSLHRQGISRGHIAGRRPKTQVS